MKQLVHDKDDNDGDGNEENESFAPKLAEEGKFSDVKRRGNLEAGVVWQRRSVDAGTSDI
jgi:hypothetical protein